MPQLSAPFSALPGGLYRVLRTTLSGKDSNGITLGAARVVASLVESVLDRLAVEVRTLTDPEGVRTVSRREVETAAKLTFRLGGLR